ncbi:polysialyltransferase family glycosyltransferase [Parapedobacter sp. 2B3]|uniref:polysialyltransferase family glycosyltransferase n=1 Tax=Parapedobacter sp. 2B3 TaxID=3342381 RepID=UPI0035B5BBBA
MSNINLFVVQSPFQMISAIEAANYFKCENNVLIVRLTGEKNNNNQIERLFEFFQWTRVICIRHLLSITVTDNKLAFYLNKIKRNERISYLFIGEIRSRIMQAYIDNLNYDSCFLLDDGVSTAVTNKILRENSFDLTKLFKSSRRNYLINKLLYKLWGISGKKGKLIHWFSCFNIKAIGSEQVFIHRFEYLKGMMESRTVTKLENVIFFIGSNLSGVGVMDVSNELRLLKLMAKKYSEKGIHVVYCSHRREAQEKLDAINAIDNMQIRTMTFPLEIAFMIEGEYPDRIATFYSSALYTLQKIYAPKYIKSFRIPGNLITDEYKDSVNKAYAYLAEEGVVIDNINYDDIR